MPRRRSIGDRLKRKACSLSISAKRHYRDHQPLRTATRRSSTHSPRAAPAAARRTRPRAATAAAAAPMRCRNAAAGRPPAARTRSPWAGTSATTCPGPARSIRRAAIAPRQQVADQRVAGLGRGDRRQFAEGAVVALAHFGDGGVDLQAAAPQQAMQQALVQRPRLDAAAGALVRSFASSPRSTVSRRLFFAEPEAVVLDQRQRHRKQAQQDYRQQHQRGHGRGGRHPAQLQVAGIAEQLASGRLEEIGDHPIGEQLPGAAESRGHHDHAAIGNQAQAHDFGGRQRQQAVGNAGRLAGLRQLAAMLDQVFQRQGLVQPQHPHLRLGFLPPADSSRTSATPNIRCSSDWCRTTLWMRENGISRRLRCSTPSRMLKLSLPMR